jgi:hypothetical protein
MTESTRPRQTRRLGAMAFAATLGALLGVVIAASWQRIGAIARQDAAREAELDDWTFANPSQL